KPRRGIGVPFPVKQHRARTTGHYDLRSGIATRQHYRLYKSVTAIVEIVPAARKIDCAFKTAAKDYDACHVLKRRCRSLEPFLQRIEQHGAHRCPCSKRQRHEGEKCCKTRSAIP